MPRLRPADTAALVIRVWREPGVDGFRGRVTYVLDATRTGETVVVVDSPERAQATVRRWLEEFVTGRGPCAEC
ncbi:MAG: hypothetical protein ACJ73E_18325 [Mycobacteriales bacterium]